MKFLVDESTDARLASYLTARGHDATFVARSHRPGLADEEVLAIARSEGRILITDDKDFGELIVRRGHPHSGVIFFRLATTVLATKIGRLDYVLTRYADRLDRFLVVTAHRVRMRHAEPPRR